jgi:hypothetical protein
LRENNRTQFKPLGRKAPACRKKSLNRREKNRIYFEIAAIFPDLPYALKLLESFNIQYKNGSAPDVDFLGKELIPTPTESNGRDVAIYCSLLWHVSLMMFKTWSIFSASVPISKVVLPVSKSRPSSKVL